jgi:transposase
MKPMSEEKREALLQDFAQQDDLFTTCQVCKQKVKIVVRHGKFVKEVGCGREGC